MRTPTSSNEGILVLYSHTAKLTNSYVNNRKVYILASGAKRGNEPALCLHIAQA